MTTRALALLAALAFASDAHADDDAKLRWGHARPRFRPVEYVATGVLGPLAIAEYFAVPPQTSAHWTGGILFDDALRDAIRLRSPDALRASWAFADATGVTLVLLSVALDSLVIPLARGSPEIDGRLQKRDVGLLRRIRESSRASHRRGARDVLRAPA